MVRRPEKTTVVSILPASAFRQKHSRNPAKPVWADETVDADEEVKVESDSDFEISSMPGMHDSSGEDSDGIQSVSKHISRCIKHYERYVTNLLKFTFTISVRFSLPNFRDSRNPSALSNSTEDGKENDAESGNMPGLACMDDNSSLPVKIDVNGWLRV